MSLALSPTNSVSSSLYSIDSLFSYTQGRKKLLKLKTFTVTVTKHFRDPQFKLDCKMKLKKKEKDRKMIIGKNIFFFLFIFL